MNPSDFKMPKWPLWKRALRVVLDCFELDDHEYIRLTVNLPWPFRSWITILEPRYRSKWHRRVMPWRFRIALASLIRQWVWSQCTVCNSRFTLRELLRREGLTHFMSGSICHKECPPTAWGLLRRVHNDALNGYLYSGPTRNAVARFLGMPEYRWGGPMPTPETHSTETKTNG